MARKAKLISTGEIVEVYADMDYHGNTTWLDTSTDTIQQYALLERVINLKLNNYGSKRLCVL